MPQVDAHLLLRAAKPATALLLQVAYYGALRVSELADLTWGQVLPRETGEAQLAAVDRVWSSQTGEVTLGLHGELAATWPSTSWPSTKPEIRCPGFELKYLC